MASFLSYVYGGQASTSTSFLTSSTSVHDGEARIALRRFKHENLAHDHDDDALRSQSLPPGVSLSGSSESAWVAPQLSSQDESEDSTFVVDNSEQFLSSPFTPEGLLPRKSADSMRRRLKLDIIPRSLEHTILIKPAQGEERLAGVARILAKTIVEGDNSNISTYPLVNQNKQMYLDDEEYDDGDDNMILPPPQHNLHTKSTFGSSVQSPQISTSSFYSKQSYTNNRPVAMSPVLQVGQARTAVGALVALREAANRHPNASMAMSVTNPDTLPSHLSGVDKQKFNANQHASSMRVLPPLNADYDNDHDNRVGEEQEDSFSQGEENENSPYQASYEANLNSPNRTRRDGFQPPCVASRTASLLQGSVSQKGMVTQLHSHQRYEQHAGAVERESKSSPTSANSRLFPMEQKTQGQHAANKISGPSSGIPTTMSCLDDAEQLAYDDCEDDFDGALMARKFKNQQMRKKHVVREDPMFGDDCFENEIDSDRFDEEHDDGEELASQYEAFTESTEEQEVDDAQPSCVSFEDALLRRKARNQRHEKERLVHELAARLRDNLGLVADVDAAASRTVAAMGSWFVNTPIDGENLLTGYSSERRSNLLSRIDSILNEMELAQPEEFILSPSKVPVMAVSHDTLTQALHFCRELIVSAVPSDEKERMVKLLPSCEPDTKQQQLYVWKSLPGLQHALGVELPPQTPGTVRGGGTSLFSLPEDSGAETPHTSNVSLATSITSVNTTSARRHHTQTLEPQLLLHHDGLQIRQTVHIVSSLLQKLSLACLQLGDMNSKNEARKSVLACNDIKKHYLHMMVAITRGDALALMDAFYLEPLPILTGSMTAREVSAGEQDLGIVNTQARYPQDATLLPSSTAPMMTTGTSRSLQGTHMVHLVDQPGGVGPFDVPALPIFRRNAIPIYEENDQLIPSRGMSLFSPSTEDMRSKASDGIPCEFDDLRRQMGSYDRDDIDDTEERDGPCTNAHADGEDTDDWRQMYQNVSLAASSLRSLGRQAKASGRSI